MSLINHSGHGQNFSGNVKTCPYCKAPIQEDDEYCDKCGMRLVSYHTDASNNASDIKSHGSASEAPTSPKAVPDGKKKKWYLQTWFIGLLYMLWPAYGIPLIIAIILTVLQVLDNKKQQKQIQNLIADNDFHNARNRALSAEIASLNSKLDELDAKSYFDSKAKIDSLNQKYADMESDFNAESMKNNDIISKLRDEISNLESKFERLSKQTATQERKLQRSKELYQSVAYAIDNFTVKPFQYSDCKLSTMEFEELDLIAPSITLKLHCMDVKSLRKAYRDTEKQINTILEQYAARYTTKANRSIYQLMVIALRAELQNILYELKYEKLDAAIDKVKVMTAKYLKIAGEGNQSIAGTLTKFIGEIEYLFINAVKIEYNYYVKREQAKQEQAAIREQMRQEAAERKALEDERKRIEREESKYISELDKLKEQLIAASEDEMSKLNARILQLQAQLSDVAIKKNDIINLQNGKAGNIYIISNLGSFGDDVFKVGMTRRLNPQDRVNELGDASVPFKFDVHSFIFSDDAVSLENRLHTILNDKRVNKVNSRKEFFRISIDELEQLVYDIEPTAEFNKTMLAEEFRQSLSTDKPYTDDYQLADDEAEE